MRAIFKIIELLNSDFKLEYGSSAPELYLQYDEAEATSHGFSVEITNKPQWHIRYTQEYSIIELSGPPELVKHVKAGVIPGEITERVITEVKEKKREYVQCNLDNDLNLLGILRFLKIYFVSGWPHGVVSKKNDEYDNEFLQGVPRQNI